VIVTTGWPGAGVKVVVAEVVGGLTGVVELPPQVLEANARQQASHRQRMRTPPLSVE
jgi:hypothetical protein